MLCCCTVLVPSLVCMVGAGLGSWQQVGRIDPAGCWSWGSLKLEMAVFTPHTLHLGMAAAGAVDPQTAVCCCLSGAVPVSAMFQLAATMLVCLCSWLHHDGGPLHASWVLDTC